MFDSVLRYLQKLIRLPATDRLLKETGRLSIAPVYVVGIYSGADQLGEGFGSSLKWLSTEYVACVIFKTQA